ncbi:putative transposase [Serratia sp. BIGb0163]|nr:putative transposase [Serratia sp. BIGb0163]
MFLYGSEMGKIFHEVANQKSSQILEGHLMCDHVHMCISISPKHSVSTIVCYLKGKSAIARHFGRSKNFTGEVFWARDYFVSPGATVRAYIRSQEREDVRDDQIKLNV